MRTVELEQYEPPSLFGRSVNMRTGRMDTDARWNKLDDFKGEQGADGKWTLTAYYRRTDETKVESGFQDLAAMLDRVASIRGVDNRFIRVHKP